MNDAAGTAAPVHSFHPSGSHAAITAAQEHLRCLA